MKTKELIRRLHEADPDGECECCIDNFDILNVARMESYWDGRLEVLVRDPTLIDKVPYDLIGAKVTSKGDKIKIRTLSIEEALYMDAELPVDLSELGNPDFNREWANKVAVWREEARQFERDILEERHRERNS